MAERHVLQVYVGSLSRLYEALSIEASKITTADEIVECICEKLGLHDGAGFYELAEVMGNEGGQDCKERRIGHQDCPVALQLLWPKKNNKAGGHPDFKFCLRRKLMGNFWSLSMSDSNDSQLIRDYFLRFLYQPRNCEYSDLCQLPDLTEQTLLENLKARFEKGHIYTYVGSILIAVNPFTFYPIYNPKYVQLYQNRRLGELQPHIFAIADAAYQSMLRKRTNQCIVISGESGSGKTESTNLLLHHLTALSQKGTHGSGVEQTILGAGPVLEAFGNAKTKFNNNSSRFGKFIQVNYKENGAVHGALVQKYLLEKSRIVSQVKSERNYHVFYYLLDGLSSEDKEKLYLTKPSDYFYLNQSKCYTLEGVDERHEFSRLTQSMEMVGFSRQKQFLCFKVLSAVLHLGNVQFSKKSTYHSDETVMVKNPEVVTIISKLLQVKEETLTTALTCKRTKAAKGEMLVINYKLPDAIATRDAMAKCLYGALFDWIVMQVNHALLSKKDPREHKGNSIGVLDIFGFEDFADHNNFEQFCINYANERLQYYFNQHVFKYEQEEYQREGISWRNIDFNDNTECLKLIEDKPSGLLYLLDDQCNFPCGSNETVLQKFIYHHNSNSLFEVPPCRGSAFIIKHYAGKVKYQIRDFREKNLDLMRPDIVSVLKVSKMAFVRELVCSDPLALFRWQILKAFFKAYFLFSKLRELSKMKRGLTDAYLIKEFSASNRRRTSLTNSANSLQLSRTLSSDTYRDLHPTLSSTTSDTSAEQDTLSYNYGGGAASPGSNVPVLVVPNNASPSYRITRALLSRQALFANPGPMTHTPQCVHGALMRTASTNFSCPVHGSQAHLCSSEARVLSRANKILMKKKYSSSYHLSRKHSFDKSIRNFKLLKQLLGPPGSSNSSVATSTVSVSKQHGIAIPRATRKQTPTVTHQFQQSLQQLMDTLSHANPFFVRCIKSNADKMPNHFDDRLVLQQLRYTGMLETVRIRQSGYSVRLTFDEFIQHYRILLPKGLLSSKMDVKDFLLTMKLQPNMYQIGKTKVFMRESEKLVLDERLHEEILRRIINLQRWVRTWLCRKRFAEMRNAAIVIQTYARRYIAQRRLSQLKLIAQYENWAANCIQKHWRCYQMRKWFTNLRRSVVNFQSSCRGYLLRSRMGEVIEEHSKSRDEAKAQANKKNSVSVSIRTMPPVSQPKNSQSTSSLSRPVTVNSTVCPSSSHSDYYSTVNISSIPSTATYESCQSMSELSETSIITTSIDQMHVHEQRETSFPSTYYNYSPDSSSDLLKESDLIIRKDGNNNANAAHANLITREEADQDQAECDFDDDFEKDDHVRLNRKRNIPIRKTSFKRKANKSLSDDKLLTTNDELPPGLSFNTSNTNLSENQQHRQLTKLSSDSNVLLASTSSLSAFSSSGYNTNSDSASSFYKLRFDQMQNAEATNSNSNNNQAQIEMQQQQMQHYRSQQIPASPTTPTQGSGSNQFMQHNRLQNKYSVSDESQSIGPIQKAKTTIKNIMGKSSNQDINKRMLKQSISVKSGAEFDSQNENIYNYSNNKCLSNIDIGGDVSNFNLFNYNSSSQHNIQSQLTTQQLISYNSSKPRLSQEGNFTLLSSHSIKKEEHFKSGEICAICENTMLISSINQSQAHYKCVDCRQLFHNKCIHLSTDIPCIKESHSGSSNNSSSVLSALNPSRPPRNKQKKVKNFNQKSYFSKENQESSATLLSHNLLSTSDLVGDSQGVLPATKQSVRITQFTDPNDILITDLDELQTMNKFITKKIREMEDVKKKTKESMVDIVYNIALKEFKGNLISTYSVGNQDGYFRLTYKDLIDHFEQILINVCQKEKTYTSFPVIMGVNAFRGYMDELRKLHNKNDPKVREEKEKDKVNGYNSKKSYKRKQSKKARNRNKKEDEIFTSYEHEFILSTANIYTVCEVCSSYMWLMEKIWVCRRCKLTCHKKCVDKVAVTCRDNSKSSNKTVFGAALTSLTNEDCRIPYVVEQLITKIELKGLYTEGIYRKSGTSSKINELKQLLDAQIPEIDLDQYSIHVLAATLKLFFREMPEPLMTYELYDDFLWATTISDATERVQVILNHIGKLPKENYDLLERLTFHLARVAQQESANRMNANSLAIVFAPCVLRTNKMMQMQDKLHDISKQTICIESIISERMRQISDTLNDIDILDTACHTTSSRLSSIRHSKLNLNRDYVGLMRTTSNVDEEEALLAQHLDDLITEKNHLTTILPVFRLASACSDEDMLSSNENEESANANSAGSGECLSPATVPTTLGPSYQPTNMKTNVTFINNLNNTLTNELTNANKKYNSNLQSTTGSKPRVTLQQKLNVIAPMSNIIGNSGDDSSPIADHEEPGLCHLTKNRVHTPHKRKPSRFDHPHNVDMKDNCFDSNVNNRNQINSDMSGPDANSNNGNNQQQQSNEAKPKFSSHENENPVMV